MARTDWTLRCAQPPYDRLPVARVRIPAGIVLSREGDAWIAEEDVRGTALPVYVGKMIYVANWAPQTRRDTPSRIDLDPEFLLDSADIRHNATGARIAFRDISNSTNERGFVSALIPAWYPAANSTPTIEPRSIDFNTRLDLAAVLSSLAFDWNARQRMSGTHVNWHIAASLGLLRPSSATSKLRLIYARAVLSGSQFAPDWLKLLDVATRPEPYSVLQHERLRLLSIVDAVIAALMGLSEADLRHVVFGCDHPPNGNPNRDPKGFWRVDKDEPPERRRTVLAFVAFLELVSAIRDANGDRDEGINAFLAQNHGDGWVIPEDIRLVDYDLGHDQRADSPQPVARHLGPRFHDWQLAQTDEQAWLECHLHARNLLGAAKYADAPRSAQWPLFDAAESTQRGETKHNRQRQLSLLSSQSRMCAEE